MKNFTHLAICLAILASFSPAGTWAQEGFLRFKNSTGVEANDLHIAFKAGSKVPTYVQVTLNGQRQPYGGVFKKAAQAYRPVGRTRQQQLHWDFDDATRSVKSGECVAILINWPRAENGDPLEVEIDFDNSYWTKDGKRIEVPKNPPRLRPVVPNKIAPEDFAQRGIAIGNDGRPMLPASPSEECD